MKRKTLCIISAAIILLNALNPAFALNFPTVEKGEDEVFGKVFEGEAAQPSFSVDSNFNHSNTCWPEKNLEDYASNLRDKEDYLNLSDANEWAKYAYRNGNKTRLIVGFNEDETPSLSLIKRVAEKYEAEIVNVVSFGGRVKAVVVELPIALVSAFQREIRTLEIVGYVEPNMRVQAQLVPNDPYWNMQWGPKKIMADWAWNTTIGSSDVLVAVVDTGIYYWHEDLAANYAPLGYDWVNMDDDPLDDNGHGTHCAGIIAAVLNNGIGIAGLAQVRIMAEKVLDSRGYGYWDWVANGIVHAADSGAKIISMSLGGYGYSKLLHEAVKYAYNKGVLIIAAAGNDNTNMKVYPAGYDEVIAVAATDQYDSKAWFSNWGEWIELAAPGVDIISTVPWGYARASGTSMACPHVSGLAALLWSLYPQRSRDWIRLWLRFTAEDLGSPGFDAYYGYGRINAGKAFQTPQPDHDLVAYEWQTPTYLEPETSGLINASILNFGGNSESNILVQLLANNTPVSQTQIEFLEPGASTVVSLNWQPSVEGIYNITLYVAPAPGEVNLENNRLSKFIYVGRPVKAVVLHSAGNVIGEIITNWDVLNTQWNLFGSQMVYIDYTTLNKDDITYQDIAATKADVLIISCAYNPTMGWQFTDSEIEAIKRYVREGHGLIATAGTLYYWVPNNNKLAPLFGLNETIMWSATGTDLLHLLNATHPVFRNVPNPLVFPKVGTATPYDGCWDGNELVDGKYLALGHYFESAIVARRGLIYISPWLEIIPPYYHHHLQLLYNAIVWSRYQKPAHDLEVTLQAPETLKPGQTVKLNATVCNMGLNTELNVTLKILVNGETVNSTIIEELAPSQTCTISYTWAPKAGNYNVTAYTPPVAGEESVTNNVDSASVTVGFKTSIFVTEDNWPTPPDYDLDCYIYNTDPRHPIDWMHFYSGSTKILGAKLQIYTWDVDWPEEVDEVYFNGHYVGQLKGADFIWSLNEFWIPAEHIRFGVNVVEVYVDRKHVGWYGTTVDWANLTVFYIPYQHDLAVGLEAPKYVRRGAQTILNVTVYNLGLNMESDVKLQILVNGSEARSATIPLLEPEEAFSLNFQWVPMVDGLYNITAYVEPVEGEEMLQNNFASKNVEVIPPIKVAVLGDFESQLTTLLSECGITAEKRGWDIISEIQNYNAVIVNDPGDPGYGTFLRFIQAADSKHVGLIFTSSYPGPFEPYGISLLQWYLGDPQGQGYDYGCGPVYYQVLDAHPILEGWGLGEKIYIITGGDMGHSWFWGYSGKTIADIGAEYKGLRGAGIAYKIRETGNKHLLLAGLAPQKSTNVKHWTENARQILIKGVIWVSKPYIHEIAITRLETSAQKVPVGEALNITVEAENRGNFTETFNIDVYASPSNSTLKSGVEGTIQITPQNSMWIEPPILTFNTATTPVGYIFNVTIYTSLNVPSYAWQMYLTYNKNHLKATGCWYSAGTKSQWAGANPTSPVSPVFGDHNATHNYVFFGEALQGVVETPPGTYSLAVIEFQITAAPPPGQTFQSELRLDIPGTFESYILDVDFNEIPLVFRGSVYVYSPLVPPPSPPLPPGTIKIATITVRDLAPGLRHSETVSWNTAGLKAGNYTVWAYASTLPGEVDVENNRFVDGSVLLVEKPKAFFAFSPSYPMPGETVIFNASASKPNGGLITAYEWDFGDGQTATTTEPLISHVYIHSGLYNVSLTVFDSEGLWDTASKSVYVCHRDITIVKVEASANRVYVGRKITVNVTVTNNGETAESFRLILYYNISRGDIIGETEITNLAPGEFRTVNFLWDTSGVKPGLNYTITAYAPPLFGERNIDDNIAECAHPIHVKIVGDVNGDSKIDIKDVALASRAFGKRIGDPGWNSEADINGDNRIDVIDIAMISRRFGSTCQT
jgi:thermitase